MKPHAYATRWHVFFQRLPQHEASARLVQLKSGIGPYLYHHMLLACRHGCGKGQPLRKQRDVFSRTMLLPKACQSMEILV